MPGLYLLYRNKSISRWSNIMVTSSIVDHWEMSQHSLAPFRESHRRRKYSAPRPKSKTYRYLYKLDP